MADLKGKKILYVGSTKGPSDFYISVLKKSGAEVVFPDNNADIVEDCRLLAEHLPAVEQAIAAHAPDVVALVDPFTKDFMKETPLDQEPVIKLGRKLRAKNMPTLVVDSIPENMFTVPEKLLMESNGIHYRAMDKTLASDFVERVEALASPQQGQTVGA